jgi:hypothetical protein
MKKILLILFLSFSSFAFSQELNDNASFIKQGMPETYEAIKQFSEEKWETDYSMVLHEINKQSDAFKELMEISGLERSDFDEIFIAALVKWTENPETLQKGGMEAKFQNPNTDWSMVVHEMKKQIQAKDAY